MMEQGGDDDVTINEGKDFPSFEVICDTQSVKLSELYPFKLTFSVWGFIYEKGFRVVNLIPN